MNNLLIVDDEAQIRNSLAQVFTQTGYVVRVASDGFTALQLMRETLPDLLLSDLNMPGMSGFELLSVVRRRLPSVYVIATSGAYAGDAVPEGVAADAFYQKASDLGTLLRLVQAGSRATPPHLRGSVAPLWIDSNGEEPTGAGVAIVTCPECLRAWAQPLAGAAGQIHETVCRDCRTPIRYAVVTPLDPATSQPFRPQPSVAHPAMMERQLAGKARRPNTHALAHRESR
jgi:CheY-like chemotaxis protein